MTARRRVAAANWKMNLLRRDAAEFASALGEAAPFEVDVLLFPAATSLAEFAAAVVDHDDIGVGGQDLHPEESGAHTGDLSAAQLLDAGASWALCGHSERRADHGESDTLVGQKLARGLASGLHMMLCIGESLDQRESGSTNAVLERQLRAAWAEVERLGDEAPLESALADVFAVAYEPVWAIGTGRTATPELAQEAHAFVRSVLADLLGASAADAIRILYGGSVKPANCRELIAPDDIDGFLVGGASLESGSFLDIIAGCTRGN